MISALKRNLIDTATHTKLNQSIMLAGKNEISLFSRTCLTGDLD